VHRKPALSGVAILIAHVMRSFADQSMQLSSPLSQLADFIPRTTQPHDAPGNSAALARGLPLAEAAKGPETQEIRNDGPSDEVMYDSPTGSLNFRDVLADRSFSQP
jgi:hypothetical protein